MSSFRSSSKLQSVSMHPAQPREFVFSRYTLDQARGEVVFEYVVRFEERPEERFQDVMSLPKEAQISAVPPALLERCLQSLHLILGISYWKMYCPAKMCLEAGYGLDAEQAKFWTTVYTKGLGEFFYRHQIDFRDLIHFPVSVYRAEEAISYRRRNHVLLPIGGGKDSMVSADLLTEIGIPFRPFVYGASKVQADVMRFFAERELSVQTKLDPQMIAPSKSGAAYNGHVPITTVWSFGALLMAVLCDYAWVVFSNEASASEGNVEYLGLEINHQWSKSIEAEQLIRNYIHRYVTPDVTLFSLLRPLSELAIAKRFSRSAKRYLGHVSSCNRNFVVSKAQPERLGKAYWCGECPKCAFVFALLAAFVPKDQLVDAIGRDLFADSHLEEVYRELLGIKGIKPFECVGTPEETRLAFYLAGKTGSYTGEPIMELFQTEVAPLVSDWSALETRVLTPNADTVALLPKPFQAVYTTL